MVVIKMVKINAIVILAIIIISVSLTGCFHENDNKKELIQNLTFKRVKDNYIYFPVVLSDSNNTVINIEEYSIIKGDGKIDTIIINGYKMLNITIFTDEIDIGYRKDTSSNSITRCCTNQMQS